VHRSLSPQLMVIAVRVELQHSIGLDIVEI
jgi:hypothetical protein